MKALSLTVSGDPIASRLYPATVTPSLISMRQVTIHNFPASNPNFSRAIRATDEYVIIQRGAAQVAFSIPDLITLALTQETGLTWTPPVPLGQPSSATAAGTAYATQALTSDNTNVSDAETVTIGSTVYRFKSTMDSAYDVQIGTDADSSLLNLAKAINASGTAANYYTGTLIHPTVSASETIAAHVLTATAKAKGVAGNSIATTETSAHLAWGNTTLLGGTGTAVASFIFPAGSEYALTYAWYESADDGATWGSALTTTGVYNVATPGTLTITNPSFTMNGNYYKCIVTDDAGSYGLTNGSITSDLAILTVA